MRNEKKKKLGAETSPYFTVYDQDLAHPPWSGCKHTMSESMSLSSFPPG